MRILIVSQFYPPETGAAQNRLGSLARDLTESGHDVTVLTALPNYPHGRIAPGYRGRLWLRSRENGITVVRCWLLASRSPSTLRRGIAHLSFAVVSFFIGLMFIPRMDWTLWETPSLLLGPTAYLLSRLKRSKLITNVSDLWPGSLVELGAMRSGLAYRILRGLEEFLYRRSVLISGQTKHIVADISSRIADVPVVLWRNGAELEGADPKLRDDWRARWSCDTETFVIGYAGLIGTSQGVDSICAVAASLPNENVKFVLVGDGVEKDRLVAQTAPSSSLVWVPSQPKSAMGSIWASFDCSLVVLRDTPILRGAVPSKLLESMLAGIPIVLAAAGESAELVREHSCGLVVDPGDLPALRDAIRRLHADSALRQSLGEAGHKAANRHFRRREINKAYIDRLVEEVGGGHPRSHET